VKKRKKRRRYILSYYNRVKAREANVLKQAMKPTKSKIGFALKFI